MNKLGVITIGEAPRKDVQPVFDKYLANKTEVIQVGVLDGLKKQEAEIAFKPEGNEYTMVSRFVSGDSVKMSRNKITSVIQSKIELLEDQGCTQILLLCTGVFNGLRTKHSVLIEPEKIIPLTVTGLVGEKRFGIIGPLKKQSNLLLEKWSHCKTPPVFVSASPYVFNEKELRTAARSLREQDVRLILLDCMGYTEEMKKMVKEEVGRIPVVLSNALVVKLITELLE
ncbi:AroM family protein [Litchfieldia alkalitelluris]|uniref:AroM family protein n=1 Tax=Litchfieldia alkalitelluris TaxID=304268 RepID=UPI0009965ECE|nr:AroM family protein [Litchfieldia alkalitelluris]